MTRALAALLLAALPLGALAGPEPYKVIQSTGGLEVGSPFHSADGWLLRVRARLSKLPAPKGQKDAPDGGPSCARTQAAVEGDSIFLTIVSGEARGPVAAVCPAARLGELEAGHYKVFYREAGGPTTLLREIDLSR